MLSLLLTAEEAVVVVIDAAPLLPLTSPLPCCMCDGGCGGLTWIGILLRSSSPVARAGDAEEADAVEAGESSRGLLFCEMIIEAESCPLADLFVLLLLLLLKSTPFRQSTAADDAGDPVE